MFKSSIILVLSVVFSAVKVQTRFITGFKHVTNPTIVDPNHSLSLIEVKVFMLLIIVVQV